MAKSGSLRTGSSIYDSPKAFQPEKIHSSGIYAGYNCGFAAGEPSYSVGSTNKFTAAFERQCYTELVSVLGLHWPEEWDTTYCNWVLFRFGFMAILDYQNHGQQTVTAQKCTLAGRGVQWQPIRFIVSNYLLPDKKRWIGKDGELLRLTPDYTGAWPIIHQYAEALAECWQSIQMAIVNSRFQRGFIADDQAAAATGQALLETADSGSPGVVVGKTVHPTDNNPLKGLEMVGLHPYEVEVGHNYILDKLLQDYERIHDTYLRCIGVPIMSDKKERLISGEVAADSQQAMCQLDVWRDSLRRSICKIKKLYPALDLYLEEPEEKEGAENVDV